MIQRWLDILHSFSSLCLANTNVRTAHKTIKSESLRMRPLQWYFPGDSNIQPELRNTGRELQVQVQVDLEDMDRVDGFGKVISTSSKPHQNQVTLAVLWLFSLTSPKEKKNRNTTYGCLWE